MRVGGQVCSLPSLVSGSRRRLCTVAPWCCETEAFVVRRQGFTNAQVMELMQAEEMAAERDQEIQKICQSIEQLAILFRELATMVIDQGTIIDRIDEMR